MSMRILPVVRFIFACKKGTLAPTHTWAIEEPYTIVGLPPGTILPIAIPELAIFVHLTEGLGDFEAAAECRQVRDDGTYRTLKMSPVVRFTATRSDPQAPLFPVEVAFAFKDLPIKEAGLYEFYITVDNEETGGRIPLSGESTILRVVQRV